MQVLVAMSGGVDSSVAAALVRDAGHEVVGVTLKLWGGESDAGCCSVSDVDDARWAAARLGIEHLVFNFGDDFTRDVVEPYVADHAAGRTPNPCIECNRHLKFGRLLRRARALGFDAVATGHHARVVPAGPGGGPRLARGADRAKDQSYVLHVLDAEQLARVQLPVGELTKDEVRRRAAELGLRTATKPDSQDVCFVPRAGTGRREFLAERISLRPGRLVDRGGQPVGTVDAVELVTVGQRRGLGPGGDGSPRYALAVDAPSATVVVGPREELLVEAQRLDGVGWVDARARSRALAGDLVAQTSAHGRPAAVREVVAVGADGVELRWVRPERRVAPGQSVVLYDGDVVLGGGLAAGGR